MPRDRSTDPESGATRRFEAARRRMRALHLRRGFARGLLRIAPATGALLLSPALGVDPDLARVLAVLSILVLPLLDCSRRWARCTPEELDRWWERSRTPNDESGATLGLVAAARHAHHRTDPGEVEAAILIRFARLPLPTGQELARVLPPTPISSIALVLALLLVIAALPPPSGGSRSSAPSAARADSAPETPPTVNAADTSSGGADARGGSWRESPLTAQEARRRAAIGEELARVLGDTPALASLRDALRAGGTVAQLSALGLEDLGRLRRAARHGRTRGAPEAWTEEMEAAAERIATRGEGEQETLSLDLGVGAGPRTWARAEGVEGAASGRDPSRLDGGSASAPLPDSAELRGTAAGAGSATTETAAGTLALPPGRPFAPGAAEAQGPVRRDDLSTSERDAREAIGGGPLELEPRWYPVIEAYRRGGSPR